MGYPFFTCPSCRTSWDDSGRILNALTHDGCDDCISVDDHQYAPMPGLIHLIRKAALMLDKIKSDHVRGGMS